MSGPAIYLDLVQNLAYLVALTIVSGFFERRWPRNTRAGGLMQGVLFGGAAVIGMLRPLNLGPGLIFDGRSVMVSLCALFFGPWAAVVALAMAVACRVGLGGMGALTGVLVTVSSAAIGVAAHFRLPPDKQPPSALRLYLFGVAVHLAMLALMFTLPDHAGLSVVARIGLPVLGLYPLATVLAGKILSDQVSSSQTEAELRRSETKFRTLYDATGDAVLLLDDQASVIDCNRAALAVFGYDTRDELRAKRIGELSPPTQPCGTDSLTLARRRRDTAVANGSHHFEWVHRRGDSGESFSADVLLTAMQLEGKPAIQAVVRDITERKRAEATMLRIVAAVEQTSDAVGIVDAEGNAVYGNPAMLRLTGRQRGDATRYPSPPLEVFVDDATPRDVLTEILSGGRPEWSGELDARRPDGEIVPVSVRANAVRDEGGRPLGVVVVLTDLTNLRHAEDAQRLAVVGGLAAGVAHEFNNLLAGMMLQAEMAALSQTSREYEKLADLVLRATRRGADVCRNLTTFARPREPVREAISIEAAVEAALGVVTRQLENAGVAVVRSEQTAGRRIAADQGQLEQVFVNLFINACHAMPAGGTLTVTTRHESASEGLGEIIATVADTGTGIRPGDLPRIFDPFFTTKGRLGESDVPGTGLGVSVTHGIVRAHGATIDVASIVNEGTTVELRFTVHEPLGPAPAASDSHATAPPPLATPPLRILVAEDEEDIALLVAESLSQAGHTVVSVGNGLDAVAALREDRFDLVITDLLMPGGGGRQVLAATSSLPTPPPVIVITGRIEPHVEGELAEMGARAYLRKPFSFPDVLRAIADVIAAS